MPRSSLFSASHDGQYRVEIEVHSQLMDRVYLGHATTLPLWAPKKVSILTNCKHRANTSRPVLCILPTPRNLPADQCRNWATHALNFVTTTRDARHRKMWWMPFRRINRKLLTARSQTGLLSSSHQGGSFHIGDNLHRTWIAAGAIHDLSWPDPAPLVGGTRRSRMARGISSCLATERATGSVTPVMTDFTSSHGNVWQC